MERRLGAAADPRNGGLKIGPKRRVEQKQFVELPWSVADIVRSDDEDVPSLFEEGSSFGNGHDYAQAHGDRNIVAL
jgi:hypothetical protein